MAPVATVVILTYNGEEFLHDCLSSCLAQETSFPFDVLVIDSGSTDGTLEIIGGFPDVRLHQIPNEDFGHGRTRNLGASMAGGEFVAFLVQDAVPASPAWLEEMIRPFLIADRIGCVYGRQVPRPSCCIAVKRDVLDYFGSICDRTSLRLDVPSVAEATAAERGRRDFLSDVNSALRLDAWHEVPFRDIAYAEDRVLAADMLAAGWLKVYTPFGAVEHSHDLQPRAYYRRMHDEFSGLRHAEVDVDDRLARLVYRGGRDAWRNLRAASTDLDYDARTRRRQMALGPVYAALRGIAIRASRS